MIERPSDGSGLDDPTRDGLRVSYAQNFEDVRLWKALGRLEDHIWVDVGAAHPVDLSVTRLFLERGWHGINVEPGPNIDLLRTHRPGDVNLAVAVTDHDGEIEFNVALPYTDLSSMDLRNLEADPVHVTSWEVIRCPAMTLATVLEQHAGGAEIAFLKVDVEGAEREVLLGNDWDRFRPLVVVAESIEPTTHRPSFAQWEPILLDAGYEFAVDDGINRFYARADHPEIRERLAAPVSALDGFVQHLSFVHDVGDIDERMARALADRDRALEETAARLASVERHEAALVAAVDHLRARSAELEAELVAVRASWGMRIGRFVLRIVRPVLPLLRPFRPLLAPRRR